MSHKMFNHMSQQMFNHSRGADVLNNLREEDNLRREDKSAVPKCPLFGGSTVVEFRGVLGVGVAKSGVGITPRCTRPCVCVFEERVRERENLCYCLCFLIRSYNCFSDHNNTITCSLALPWYIFFKSTTDTQT